MKSVALMILSVFLFSIYPVLAVTALQDNGPIAFIFMAHFFCAGFSLLCGVRMLRKKHGSATPWKDAFTLDRPTWKYAAVTGAAAAFNHACLMYAFVLTSEIGATIIYETWPIIAVWLTPILVAKGWREVRRMDYVFGALAVVGGVFIVGSLNREALLGLDFAGLMAADTDRLTGYLLAFAGSIGVSISTTLRRNVSKAYREKYGEDLLLGVYLSSGVTRLISLPVLAVIFGFLYEPGVSCLTLPGAALAAVTGISVYLMGSVCYARSILENPDPVIPIPDFIAPVMAITWLYLFGYDGIGDMVVIGALFVITANLLVTVKAEDSIAYTASILTLLLGGTYCYFTTGEPLGDFYDAMSVSAVFYAILIAFAWDRVLERSKYEEALTLDLAYALEDLRKTCKRKHRKMVEALVTGVNAVISTSDRTAIGKVYRELLSVKEKLEGEDGVTPIFKDLDSLILSKTKDVMLSEVVLLCLIGGVTFIGIMGYRPEGLWPDMMAFIMGGAIIFIFFAIFDQLNERNRNMLGGADGDMRTINAELFQSRHEFRLVTIVLIAIMLAVFYGLFVYKHAPAL